MIIRKLPVVTVEWGNGSSSRYITAADGLGYGFNETFVRPGTQSRLQYLNHTETVHCVGGAGWIEDSAGIRYDIGPGTLYVLDRHDAHTLGAGDLGLLLVCVFTPALTGDEIHKLTPKGYSGFEPSAAVVREVPHPCPQCGVAP